MSEAIDFFTWALMALSVAGTFFVTLKRVAGMWLWTATNAGWILVFLLKGLPAAAIMYAVYFGLAVWGLWKWRKKKVRIEISATSGFEQQIEQFRERLKECFPEKRP